MTQLPVAVPLLASAPIAAFSIRVRWLCVAALLGAMLLLRLWQWPLPWALLAGVVVFVAGVNLTLLWLQRTGVAAERLVRWGLWADVLALTEILLLTGGSTNPMTSLYLLPILMAALTCSPRFAWALTSGSLLAYFLLFFWHLPFPLVSDDPNTLFRVHIGGMWLTFALSAALIAGWVSWLIRALNWREARLQQAHAQQRQSEQILSLGMEAAHTAHRLSTPLNSLFLLADELNQRTDLPAEARADVHLMQQQLQQCREVLWQLKTDPTEANGTQAVPLYAGLQAQLAAWHNLRPDVRYQWQAHSPVEPEVWVYLDPLFWSACVNIWNNAADAGAHQVDIETRMLPEQVFVLGIRNRSGCLSEQQLQQAGLNAQHSDKPAGLGMGVLLSHATLARQGGSLSLSNHAEGGVYAEIRLPVRLAAAPDSLVPSH